MALRHLLLQFLGRGKATSDLSLQVLSLGAGYDTTYFQLEVRAFRCPGASESCYGNSRLQSRARTALRWCSLLPAAIRCQPDPHMSFAGEPDLPVRP